jgi:hypothetical protein
MDYSASNARSTLQHHEARNVKLQMRRMKNMMGNTCNAVGRLGKSIFDMR